VDDSDEDERMRLQLVFKSQFCSVHGMSRMDDEFTVKSELLQLFIAGVNVMLPRFVISGSILPPFVCRGSVFVGVALIRKFKKVLIEISSLLNN
jgi:hypothetical protein